MQVEQPLATMASLWNDVQQSIEDAVIPEAVQDYLPTWWLLLPVLVYLLAEVAFYVYFKTVMVPFANQIIPPTEYRDYGRDRHKLIIRILERVSRTAAANHTDDLEETAKYLMQWFEYVPGHLERAGHAHKSMPVASSSSSSSCNGKGVTKPTLLPRLSESSMGSSICSSGPDSDSDNDNDISMDMDSTIDGDGSGIDDRASDDEASTSSENDDMMDDDLRDHVMNNYADYDAARGSWTVTVLGKDDIDDFMAWGFFGKFVSDLLDWERDEMTKCYNVLEDMHGIIFQPGRSPNYRLRHLLSLEPCVAMHRPLAFYAKVQAMKWCASQLFRLAGFSRHVTESGVVCWHKPAADDDYSQQLLPLCLFHGVGPGGLAFYTLLVILGLNRTGRAIFLFENHSVACTLNFKAISEQDTISGVKEMIDRFCGPHRHISLMGHSFGSSALTWLLHSELRPRIRQMVILEPVSIMLSEADVIMNMAKPIFKMAIDLVLEHYIRRQFPWYNSELWLEDIPEDVHVIIGLAGKDPIICTQKVTQEIEAFCHTNPKKAKNMDFIYWKNNLHGMCLGLPWCWKDINDAMLKQELAMMQSKSARRRRNKLQ